MKDLGYAILKFYIRTALYLYYGKIEVAGLEKVPRDKPVLFLPNHQSALIDVLLLAVNCGRKPYFLTRSDVFKKPLLKRFFTYLQMIPIYRIRDGRESLKNNDAVFGQCADILERKEAILMFPEANHNIKRRVRPLSKGFTRILFGTLDKFPNLDIQIIPIGLNYKSNSGFPDEVAINFGEPIPVSPLYDKANVFKSTNVVKETVTKRLKTLTTHIEDAETYDQTISYLNRLGVNYLKPSEVNTILRKLEKPSLQSSVKSNIYGIKPLLKWLFVVANFPVVLLWRGVVKPKIWEPEFTATLRFGYALLFAPVFYAILFTGIFWWVGGLWAFSSVLLLLIFNLFYVKIA